MRGERTRPVAGTGPRVETLRVGRVPARRDQAQLAHAVEVAVLPLVLSVSALVVCCEQRPGGLEDSRCPSAVQVPGQVQRRRGLGLSDERRRPNLFGTATARREPLSPRPLRLVDLPRNLSADGQRAFFETARPLLAADENHATDVYEWEDSDLDGVGELRLISTGRNATDSEFLDASPSGNDVFFTARDQLVGMDDDESQVDLYDARDGRRLRRAEPFRPAAAV